MSIMSNMNKAVAVAEEATQALSRIQEILQSNDELKVTKALNEIITTRRVLKALLD